MGRRLLLASPHMSDEGFELEYVHDAFNKNWIAPLGENVNGFEADMAQYFGAEHTVALSAGDGGNTSGNDNAWHRRR